MFPTLPHSTYKVSYLSHSTQPSEVSHPTSFHPILQSLATYLILPSPRKSVTPPNATQSSKVTYLPHPTQSSEVSHPPVTNHPPTTPLTSPMLQPPSRMPTPHHGNHQSFVMLLLSFIIIINTIIIITVLFLTNHPTTSPIKGKTFSLF